MKKFIVPLLAGSMLVISGCAQNNSLYQYPFKSAKIEYAISGTTEGKSTVLIKGDESIREAHVVFHKQTGDENQDNLYIDTGEYIYSIDLDKKVGTMTKNPLYDVLQGTDPSMRQDFLKKIAVGLSPDSAATQQLQSTGTSTVAGQVCDIYDTGGFGQICLWNNIPIKTTISIPDLGLSNNTVATSIQTDVDVPDTAFDVPAGITMQKVGVDGSVTALSPQTQDQTQASDQGQTQQ